MKMKQLIFLFILLAAIPVFSQQVTEEKRLEVKDHYGKEALTTVELLDAYHYRGIRFRDSLANVVLVEYINSLDNSRMYFYQSDIETFHKYFDNRLDDKIRSRDVSAAFDMYKVFEKRFAERMEYIRKELMGKKFDFTVNEYYEVDRSNLPWPEDKDAMNDIWRKTIKSQVLSLKLADKSDAEIQKTIKERYDRLEKSVYQYRSDDVFQLFMNTVAMAYDPHSNYFSAVTSERFLQDQYLSLEGIGARLTSENDYTKVVEIIPGGPAFKGKELKVNDRIVAVGQGNNPKDEMVNVIGWRLDDVVKLIKGPKGTFVRLEVLPAEAGMEGPTILLTMQREKIKLEDQAAISEIRQIKKDGTEMSIGVITIPSFYMDFEAYRKGDANYNSTTRDVRRFLMEFNEKEVDGVVIDLRDNGGGSLMEAIELTGLFIKTGPVVQIRNTENKVELGEDEDPSQIWTGPLTVITNRFSASASEIFSGAIQDYGRGVIVGEQTYGKGTVQTTVELSQFIKEKSNAEMGMLKLTLQKFYRVNGASTQHKGVTPDISLPSALDAETFGESSEPAALPWDQIRTANYARIGNVTPELIAKLNKSYANRLSTDPYLKEYQEDVKDLRKSLNETKISLNEKERREELKANEQKIAQRNSLKTSIGNSEGMGSADSLPTDDEYLREALIILTEVIRNSVG